MYPCVPCKLCLNPVNEGQGLARQARQSFYMRFGDGRMTTLIPFRVLRVHVSLPAFSLIVGDGD